MRRSNRELPNENTLKNLGRQRDRAWKEDFKYDAAAVEAMVQEKRAKPPWVETMTKMELEDQREQAWEDYQACPVDDANRDKLYDKWQQLGERISEFQKRETEKKQAIQRITHNVALINTQNKSNNRSVNRKIEIRTNDTTSRPYVMTSYWDLGSQVPRA
mmetsp:Transcript_85880/g.229041  ORF Transcript_85880/g.229041 Transcript_85880/m.229041 type:complete len:160 (+) Transcript_85880:1265-1744(+)